MSVLVVCANQADAQQGVSISKLGDLSFGTIVAGISRQILPSDQGAGSFKIQVPKAPKGTSLTTASLSFVLPGALTYAANTIPVSFGASSAIWSFSNKVTNGTLFNPASGASWTNPPGQIYFWIGGTVSPPVGQAAGQYTGSMTATFTIIYF